jgi:RNA polymerase sigma-70 factor (ECF subfamily)
VRYQALDQLRHRRVEERWRREYATPLVADQGAALASDPDQELTARETAAAIQQAVDTLPRRQRQVLLLRWQQQASYDEIAETLSISPKTVAIHIGKAIQRLREILAQIR